MANPEAAAEIARAFARGEESRRRGEAYCAARGGRPDAIYVFACDHPDAHNAMFEFTPAGERIRRPGPRTASRH